MSIMDSLQQRSRYTTADSSGGGKYYGLIKPPFTKKCRNELVNLFSYVYGIAPTFAIVHHIISVIRILQLIGPSFCITYQNLWVPGSDDSTVMSIISVAFQFIPAKFNCVVNMYFFIVYICIFALMLIFVAVAAISYSKNANLPIFVASFISFFYATFTQILHPIATNLVFQLISEYINKEEEYTIVKVVLIVLTAVITFIQCYVTVCIACRTLTFRPNSFLSVSTLTWNIQFFETIVVCALAHLGTSFSGYIQIVFTILTAAVYIASAYIPFFHGGFVHSTIQKALFSTNVTCGVLCLVNTIFCVMGKNATMMFLFIYIAIWIALFFISTIIFNKQETSYLIILDELQEDVTMFDDFVKTPNKFMNILKIGFYHSHQMCINWKFCKLAIDKWPRNPNVWFSYAKFVAIYPEETQLLEWIHFNVVNTKLKGTAIQTIKEQCLAITRQRESSLSGGLKVKINKLNKQTNNTKHKLRRVWDAALQGNINEVEEATKSASDSIEQNKVDFQRLQREFSNNRFVTRPYARFLYEIVGDSQAAAEYMEKTRLLQRGINVQNDQTHTFGLEAFHNLPRHIEVTSAKNANALNESLQNSMPNDNEVEETIQINSEIVSVLKDRIDNVKIPAIRSTLMVRYSITAICFIIPFIVMLVIVHNFIKDLEEPLNHIKNLALIGTYMCQLAAFSNRWIFVKLGMFDEIIDDHTRPSQYLGGSWKTYDHLLYTLNLLGNALQDISGFKSFKPDNDNISESHKLVFSPTFTYTFYKTPTDISEHEMSLYSALSDFIIQISAITNMTNLDDSIVNTSHVLNIVMNEDPLAMYCNDALSYVTKYIVQTNAEIHVLMDLIIKITMCIVVFIYLFSLIFQIIWIKQNKENTYMCLTSLPKNIVSQLAENFRILKKDTVSSSASSDNSDISKQEENILKVLSTCGGSRMKLSDVLILVMATIIVLATEIVSIYFLTQLCSTSTYISMQYSPQLDYVQASYSKLITAVYLAHCLTLEYTDLFIPTMSLDDFTSALKLQIKLGVKNYLKVRYGKTDLPPFHGFDAGLAHANSLMDCPVPFRPATTLREVSKCFDADLIFNSMETQFNYFTLPKPLDSHSTQLRDIWMLAIDPIWDSFIAPMTDMIIPTIRDSLNYEETKVFCIVIPMMVIALIIEVIATIYIMTIDSHIRFVLHLLLHCHTDVILQTPKVVAVLAGDFSSSKFDTATRDSEFFDKVFQSLPEAILYVDTVLNIEKLNTQACALLNLDDPSEMIGKPLSELMSRFQGHVESLLHPTQDQVKEELTYVNKANENFVLLATSLVCNGKLVIILRDITTPKRYDQLITEERAKSDKLLSSILPERLVPRVQAGEKNISFAVQSATIVFMDIVSFTPWCGSLPADKVMSTLNNLFKKFDALVGKYPTMTRIKCIGDCYMAAGGVFMEVNQPAEHAKECVMFGIDSIGAVQILNSELDEKLQIRCGINTGGPIVAGVLGIGKPTFEILGPAINMAQQMEHHGVPMQVHISRTVYELVYGDMFNIKERGSVEVKGGSVITYLVTGRKA